MLKFFWPEILSRANVIFVMAGIAPFSLFDGSNAFFALAHIFAHIFNLLFAPCQFCCIFGPCMGCPFLAHVWQFLAHSKMRYFSQSIIY
jgi:hypothetical protein